MDERLEGKRVLVVGAGVAGLTAAHELAGQGAQVAVAERDETVGGLARTSRYEGMTFDLGPHRFHSTDVEVMAFVDRALGPDQRRIGRSSAVWLYNAYHDWPLGRSSVLKLPPTVMARAFADLFRRPEQRDETFESYVLSRYGRTLFDIFFAPYTEKFCTYRCDELHQDWASAGINRAVIDQRVKADSLFQLARTALLPVPVKTEFVYPASGGIDRFAESLARQIRERGGSIHTAAAVTSLEAEGGHVRAATLSNGERVDLDELVWTAPLPLLLQLLDLPPARLEYLKEVLYNFVVAGPPVLPYQWTYYGGAALSFTRASIPTHFNPLNSRPGTTGITLEVVFQEGDERWDRPELMLRDLRHDMVRVGLVRSREDVREVFIERLPEAYPIYLVDYQAHVHRAITSVSSFENVSLLGRCGTFWYNNMDHSIRQALDLAAAFGRGTTPRAWNASLLQSRAL